MESYRNILGHYGIPFTPLHMFTTNIDNPLFLTLYCKTYQGDEVELPVLYERLLEKANDKLHIKLAKAIETAGYNQSDNIVLPIVEAISKQTLLTGKRHFEKSEIESMPIWNSLGLVARPFITQLIQENILHDYEADGKNYVYFSFDQMNDYFSAKTILSMFQTEEEIRKYVSENVLGIVDGEFKNWETLLADFFKYVAKYENVKYHNVKLKKKESYSEPAYPYEDFIKLAKILFNVDYDKEHNLTLKALENSKYAEMWMFLSCHYICGWRSSDICDRWIYPDLKSNDNPFQINIDTLKEDILNGIITDDVYDKVALYAIRRIEMAYNVSQKTGFGKLRSEIVPELRTFFGKLILIAEYHHITSGEGYMNSHRTAMYRNWVTCRDFFGDDVFAITGKHSFSSRRLNKSYLQGLEQSARDNGNTTLVAHVVASFARNHANIDTTAIYLKDHGLTGESAEVVLYMMMQRGVFSVSLYNVLIAAYPKAF